MNISYMTPEQVQNLLVRELTDLKESSKLLSSVTTHKGLSGMNKNILERFIAKYSLSGICDSVSWISDDAGLTTKFAPDSKSLVGFITTKGIEIEHGEYNVFD